LKFSKTVLQNSPNAYNFCTSNSDARRALTFMFRNAFLQKNDDLRFAGKTNLPSIENECPTEMSRNKRPALNAATVTYTVSMNYPRITLQGTSQLPSACVDHYRVAIKALFTSDDQVLLTSAIIDRT